MQLSQLITQRICNNIDLDCRSFHISQLFRGSASLSENFKPSSKKKSKKQSSRFNMTNFKDQVQAAVNQLFKWPKEGDLFLVSQVLKKVRENNALKVYQQQFHECMSQFYNRLRQSQIQPILNHFKQIKENEVGFIVGLPLLTKSHLLFQRVLKADIDYQNALRQLRSEDWWEEAGSPLKYFTQKCNQDTELNNFFKKMNAQLQDPFLKQCLPKQAQLSVEIDKFLQCGQQNNSDAPSTTEQEQFQQQKPAKKKVIREVYFEQQQEEYQEIEFRFDQAWLEELHNNLPLLSKRIRK